MGINDSVTISMNDEILFQGMTQYKGKHGYGCGVARIPQSDLVLPARIDVLLHGPKLKFSFAIEKGFNSILIHNSLNRAYEFFEEFEGYLDIYYYKETDQFIFYSDK